MDDDQQRQEQVQKARGYRSRSVTERGKRYQERVKRRTEALEMRKRGKSYSAIAAALGISTAQAHVDVQLALAPPETCERELATELRAMEEERLTMAVEAITPQVLKGELQAVGRWIQVSARRSKLMGLDRPVQPATKDGNDGGLTIQVRYVDDVKP